MMSRNQKKGLQGERWATEALEKLGYRVVMPRDFFSECCDLVVNDRLSVEVKLSYQKTLRKQLKTGIGTYPRWQWDVQQVDDRDRVLILIAQDNQGVNHPFIMPGHVMAHRVRFEINSHPLAYKGLIAKFLGAWEVVEFMLGSQAAKSNDLQIGELMSYDR